MKTIAGFGLGLIDPRPDGDLLACWFERQDETAMTTLVRRYGPLVTSVCRAILRNDSDVEDAFQATFLVLIRSARSIRQTDALASWLYGVATRVSRRLFAQRSRGQAMTDDAAETGGGDPARRAALREMQQALHEEVNRLPAKYRDPFVQCHLAGLSRDEAARQLGWNLGTLSTRLASAKLILRERLSRRGIELGAALIAAGVVTTPISAATIRRVVAGVVDPTAAGVSMEVQRLATTMAGSSSRLPLLAVSMGVLGIGVAVVVAAVGPPTDVPPPPVPIAIPEPVLVSESVAEPVRAPRGSGIRVANRVAAFSPNGRTLAIGYENSLTLVDAATGQSDAACVTRGVCIERVEFSSNGMWVAVAGPTPIEAVDSVSVDVFSTTSRRGSSIRFTRAVTGMSFSPSADYVVVTTSDGRLHMIDRAGMKLDARPLPDSLADLDGRVAAVWGPGGTIAASNRDGAVVLWNPTTETVRLCKPDLGKLAAVRFDPTGQRLAIGAADGRVIVWDIAADRAAAPPIRVDCPIARIQWIIDDGTIVLVGADGSVRQIDVAENRVLATYRGAEDEPYPIVAVAPDGKTAARPSAGRAYAIVDLPSGQPKATTAKFLPKPVLRVAIAPGGGRVAAVSTNGVARVWDTATGELLAARQLLLANQDYVQIALNAQGDLLGFWGGQSNVWTINEIVSVAWSKNVVTASLVGTDQVAWIDETWALKRIQFGKRAQEQRFELQAGSQVLELSPFASYPLLVGSLRSGNTSAVGVWNLEGQELHRFESVVPRLPAVSPDGCIIGVIEQRRRGVVRWELETGRELPFVEASSYALLPRGGLVTGHTDGSIVLRDRNGTERCRFPAHEGPIRSVVATPDGQCLVSGSDDGIVRVWNLAASQP